MASIEFVESVAAEMRKILDDPRETARLGLARDIIAGWRDGQLADKDQARVNALIQDVARGNKVDLDQFEAQGPTMTDGARAAGERILIVVDSFYRKMVTRHN
jgi:hypothetical protein